MSHFEKKIRTPQGSLNFYLNRIYTTEGLRYHVSVTDYNRKAHSFNMEEKNGEWQLVNSSTCPEWIVEIEKDIEKVILEHLSGIK